MKLLNFSFESLTLVATCHKYFVGNKFLPTYSFRQPVTNTCLVIFILCLYLCYSYILFTQVKNILLVLKHKTRPFGELQNKKVCFLTTNQAESLAEIARATTYKRLFSNYISKPFARLHNPKKFAVAELQNIVRS